MNRRRCLAVTLTSSVALSAATLWALTAAPPPVAAQTPQPNPAPVPGNLSATKTLYAEKCSACHNLPNPEEKGYTRQEWQRTVNTMLTRYHASDSIAPAEAAQIVSYLATFAPKNNAPGRGGRPSDPWATNADDVWTVAPSGTHVFNFEAGNGLPGLSPLSGGTPGPLPVWQIVPEPSAPNGSAARVMPAAATRPDHFALLVDKSDQGRNLDVKVRFRVQSGKLSPAVGIMFGFTSPKNYSVLVYNQARQDLSVLKIAEPAHTTLQQTPLTLPAGATTLAAATPVVKAPLSGWHTLRLLVKDGQIRGWIDMDKRISTQDGTYAGGKVGLWTQGDTVATFDDWTIDLYDAPPVPAPPAI